MNTHIAFKGTRAGLPVGIDEEYARDAARAGRVNTHKHGARRAPGAPVVPVRKRRTVRL